MKTPFLSCVVAAVGATCAVTAVSAANPTPLIPRHVLFGNPDRASVQISPDGQWISYLAPVNGVLNVWVGPISDPASAKPVTKDTYRGIRSYFWPFTNEHILYMQDKGGDENFHIYAVNIKDRETKDLTPFEGARAGVLEVSPDFPKEILVTVNNRNPQLMDVHRVNIETGEDTTALINNEGFAGFVAEDDLRVHFATKMTPDGGSEIYRVVDGGFSMFTKVPQADVLTTAALGLDESGENLYMLDSRNRNTAALTMVNLDSQESKVIAQDDKADISNIMGHPTKRIVQAVQSTYERRRWQVLDRSVAEDFEVLEKLADGEFNVGSRTEDDTKWIVAYVMDAGPVRYYLYDRPSKKAKFLFTNRENLEDVKLSPMHAVTIKARDGLNLVSYYTLPLWTDPDGDARPDKPVPMVLLVHGGPWARDNWGYNPMHQWLANRGYAVLSVNFRGSTGLGKNFTNAGDHEWAGKMHDDLLDAVDWAVKQNIADPEKVGIMGGSYGGYATLVGLTFTPDKFACGVDIVGPSNIITLLNSIPPYWQPVVEMFTQRVGDHRTESGRQLLEERSPLTHVDRIRKPLLIGQGANDPRVKQAESDQIVKAMNERNIPVTYVLFPDEGHGFARPENMMAFNAVSEAFLAENLGGRYEPMSEDITGSSITIPAGAKEIPGLPDSIPTGDANDPT